MAGRGPIGDGPERPDLGRRLARSAVSADLLGQFGVDEGEVAFYDRPPAGLAGAAWGRSVALAADATGDSLHARAIQAHELAHVQLGGGEESADRSAVAALSGGGPHRQGAIGTGLALRGCRRVSAADEARQVLDLFAAMPGAAQEAFVAANYRSGSYAGLIRSRLEALPEEERTGKYRDTIRRLLQLVERQEVRASTGKTDAQLATAQAAFMDAEALAAAQAATGSAAPPPTAVQSAHQTSVQQLNLPPRTTNRWDALPPLPDPAQALFRVRAATAVAGIVARATVVAPELKLNAGHLHFSPETIDRATDTRYAEYDAPNRRLNFGMDFTDAAVANPDYVLGVVVHEIFGHAEHGGIGDSYALQLYGAARPQATGALSAAARAAPMTSSEKFGFGYQDTEIYAELREAQYDKRAPAAAGITQGDAPREDVLARVGLIKEKWAPDIARGLLRGMYARFALDPRITPAALRLFVDAVNTHFPGENLLAPRP